MEKSGIKGKDSLENCSVAIGGNKDTKPWFFNEPLRGSLAPVLHSRSSSLLNSSSPHPGPTWRCGISDEVGEGAALV